MLASGGQLSIALVIVAAASAAIIGDNIGYVLGRSGMRSLLARSAGPFAARRAELIGRGETFFGRHGGKTVFIGRWLPVLRFSAAWLAGAHRMEWWRFVVWNALGGIAWATSVGLVAYLLGSTAKTLLPDIGIAALAAFVLALAGLYVWRRRRRKT